MDVRVNTKISAVLPRATANSSTTCSLFERGVVEWESEFGEWDICIHVNAGSNYNLIIYTETEPFFKIYLVNLI